jgi:hypothetical protein
MPAKLQKSWAPGGKVGNKIRWNTPGDFTRCVRQARKYGMSGRVAKGMCATLHKRYTGVWPGSSQNIGKGKRIKK